MQRRGWHPLFVTAEGEYSWQVGFEGQEPLQGGQHWPISYSGQPEVRLRGTVRYGQPGP